MKAWLKKLAGWLLERAADELAKPKKPQPKPRKPSRPVH